MTTNTLIHFGLMYFVEANEIAMATYTNPDEWPDRVAPSIHLLAQKGLAKMTLKEGTGFPISANLTSEGRKRRNKELKVNL